MGKLFKLNSKGMSITEGLVLVGIVSVAFLASLTIQTKNLQVQAQDNAAASALQMMNRIRELVNNNEAWAQMLMNNPSMACLRAATSCAAAVGNPQVFNLVDPSGAVVIRSQPSPAGGGTDGFQFNGRPCNSFNMAGNDNCPISYYVTWQPWFRDTAVCPAPCINPLIRIRVEMIFRPGNNSSVKLNPANYSFLGIPNAPDVLYRSALSTSRVFRLESFSPAGAPAPGGACGGTVPRTMVVPDAGAASSGDPTGAVEFLSATRFRLRPGIYNCTASSIGFAVGGFTAQLFNVTDGTSVGSGSGLAPRWVQASASFSASFEVPANTTKDFEFRQTCSGTPGGFPNADNFALGLPIAPYASKTVYASLACSITPVVN